MSVCSPQLKFFVELQPFKQGSLKCKFINVSNMGILFHTSLFALRCDHIRVDVYWGEAPFQSDVDGVLIGLMSVLCRLGYSPWIKRLQGHALIEQERMSSNSQRVDLLLALRRKFLL